MVERDRWKRSRVGLTRWSAALLATIIVVFAMGGCPWLDTLNEDAAQGDQDFVPVDGANGQNGTNGKDGTDGKDGATGPQGLPGEQGPEGEPGPQGNEGPMGISCWDTNGNGIGDPEEDFNLDGNFNALDCQNLPGPQGLPCWDLNGNGVGDPEEDFNQDGDYDALDCRGVDGVDGAQGDVGLACWDLNGNRIGDPAEDINGDGNYNTLDCRGAPCWDINDNRVGDPDEDVNGDGNYDVLDCQGPQGLQGPPGIDGLDGEAGQECWDFNGNGVADLPDEDSNGDGVVNIYDCRFGIAFAGEGLLQDGDMLSIDDDWFNLHYWKLGGNDLDVEQVLGTLGEAAVELVVNGLRALRIEPNALSPNLIGGSDGNTVDAGVGGATVAGGGSPDDGFGNDAHNRVAGDFGTVSGGLGNLAGGFAATVPGGEKNSAAGPFSLAAGRRAQATHAGSFVWADSADEDFGSVRDNQFRIRATGGAAFHVGPMKSVEIRAVGDRVIDTSTNAFLSLGGTWTNASDLNLKDNLELVDHQAVLNQLAATPVFTWNYQAEDASIRHMGPMAQDFYASFGLGYGETSIATVDAEGVAMAAIKGLHEILQAQAAQIATQQTRIANLEQQLQSLQQRLETLEKRPEK
jgi:hypothetical protein